MLKKKTTVSALISDILFGISKTPLHTHIMVHGWSYVPFVFAIGVPALLFFQL